MTTDIVDELELARSQWAVTGHTGERDLCGGAKDEILHLRAALTKRDVQIEMMSRVKDAAETAVNDLNGKALAGGGWVDLRDLTKALADYETSSAATPASPPSP